MKRYAVWVGTIFVFIFSEISYASAIYGILDTLRRVEGVQIDVRNIERDMMNNQRDIHSLMKQINAGVVGHSGWGTYQPHEHQTYGDSARDWARLMELAKTGNGSGALAQTLSRIANQFPIDQAAFNRGVSDTQSQTYYAQQSQTILATRAASQLDYDKIEEQITYQKTLQQQIEHANDLKSAVDLNNRIQVETNLIQLAMLRQAALANQQQAMSQQANMMSGLTHAKFLTK